MLTFFPDSATTLWREGVSPSLLAFSVVGLLGVSVLCPLLAWPLYALRSVLRQRRRAPFAFFGSPSIEILLPAHNETSTLGVTLASIERAVDRVKSAHPGAFSTIEIHVGADRCKDQTVSVAQSFKGVRVSEIKEEGGKWQVLTTLCTQSTADWIILVDAGTFWPEKFLIQLLEQMRKEPDAVAFSPAYYPLHVGWLHHVIWRIEFLLKRMEVACGGPISVHGATVCYRTPPLQRALESLATRSWLNDDVVIPFTLRALDPNARIIYPAGRIVDLGVRPESRGLQRRKRILAGNLQWTIRLLPHYFLLNPIAGLIACRRLFRVLWAYWLALFLIALMAEIPAVAVGIAVVAAFTAFTFAGRDLADAAWVSLLAPFRMAWSGPAQETWK